MEGKEHAEYTTTVFVRNLPFSTTSEQLEAHFSDLAPVRQSFVVTDRETGQCRGFGSVPLSPLSPLLLLLCFYRVFF